ncbi:uncharacterized protein [Choristoneura fumiferana]|uniref:uncharacterized protein n=1 Tax=Choristoneura fumiferana TaxID=7141 RepID=UPI003D15BBC4
MAYTIKYLSLQKAELEYEVLLRGGSAGSVQELRSQIAKLTTPAEDILESHLEPAVDLVAVRESLQKSQTMLASLKSRFDKNLFLRTENLLNHIYHRSNRIINIEPGLAEQYKYNCATFNNQYRDITALRPHAISDSPPEIDTAPIAVPVTCDRSLNSDLAKLKYSGKTCVLSFIQRVNEFVYARNIGKDRLLQFAFEIFTDDALHWFRCIKEKVKTWDEMVALLRQDFGQRDYDYRLLAEIRSRTQGELENITIYLSIMHGLFTRLSKPLDEQDKLEIILHNIRPCYASTLAAHPVINDLDTLKRICSNYESIQSRQSLFHEPPRVSSETLAPEFAYTKQQRVNSYFNNRTNSQSNNYHRSKGFNSNFNNHPGTSRMYNHSYHKFTQERPSHVNAVHVAPGNSNHGSTALNKYCPRCRSNSHTLKECKQPHFPICFKCGKKGIRYPECVNCNPEHSVSKN